MCPSQEQKLLLGFILCTGWFFSGTACDCYNKATSIKYLADGQLAWADVMIIKSMKSSASVYVAASVTWLM
jgi:hypothetical protein